jgi:hypothetical protein
MQCNLHTVALRAHGGKGYIEKITGDFVMADDLADDLLNGAGEIGAFLKKTPRQTYYLLENRLIPAFKFGDKNWQARKSTLKRHVESLEAAAVA